MNYAKREMSRLRCRGFTLLEVLVSIVILAFGLLGIAGLQLNNLRYSALSASRAQASLLAEQMAERIRSNPSGAYGVAASGTVANCYTASCTVAQRKDFDLTEIQALAVDPTRGGLSSGTVSVAAASSGFTITVSWSERGGFAGVGAAQASAQAAQLQLFVRPN
ncbi:MULTISPECIES: type IV pilus modification protein PilV [Chromobacterium]|uniref:type IV pilus modification protein PilV n=1 Tax=Chromobacterium TaxID=535 RepID=UPI001889AB78|nr:MULTISPECIES: type IV pilus modification protein PilV [Chromobacterium]QOZ81912.1 type IV pilus modification protein PilV [Chromobacterium sp. Rain0013]WON81910.1 type IV pilus modification protein PilV [Chromobacterium haemolyticum]